MKTLDAVPLMENEREAIRLAAEALHARFPVEEIILFGSKARGDSQPDSDTDLLILTSRPFTWQERGHVVTTLFPIGLEHDVIFSPFVLERREWQEGVTSVLPIHYEIERDGVSV